MDCLAKRPFARLHHFTTTTRILLVFPFKFKSGYSQKPKFAQDRKTLQDSGRSNKMTSWGKWPIETKLQNLPKKTNPKFPDPRSRMYSTLLSGTCLISSGLNRLRTLLSSRARMVSALILSLMDTAVKVTPSNPLATLSGLLRLRRSQTKSVITTMIKTTVPATAPAKRDVFNLFVDG